MEESEENMSSTDVRTDSQSTVKKPKKRSLVERELETNMTALVTSPAASGDGLSTSRYGRARRLKTETELIQSQKILLAAVKSPNQDSTPVKVHNPTYRMHASNSPHKTVTPRETSITYLDNQIDNIYQENISLSRFSDETSTPSPAKKFSKVYVRKDLIQNRDEEEPIMLIKNLFSSSQSDSKSSNRTINVCQSLETYAARQNGYLDNSSVVKTLDFDVNKKKKKINKDDLQSNVPKNDKDQKPKLTNNYKVKKQKSTNNDNDQKNNLSKNDKNKDEKHNLSENVKNHNSYLATNNVEGEATVSKNEQETNIPKNNEDQKPNLVKNNIEKDSKPNVSKNDMFDIEAKCPYQVGDLAWARMGTFPFWPCIITRDPQSDMFVKKKLFGRVEHDIIHVTFLADNGRRSWLMDNMLRKYLGLKEFQATRDKFTPEDKKKDPRLFAAFFISEKKQALWNTSVEEADTLLREPKRLRIDVFNEILWNSRASKKNQKSSKIISRTNSDVSLSESLYDSLFSEQEVMTDDAERSRNRSRNKSFDVSEVVTACLDNMAAKTGITKIQRQSHMDRWLQKAKSSTPEKVQAKSALINVDNLEKNPEKNVTAPSTTPVKLKRKSISIPKIPNAQSPVVRPYKFRRGIKSNSKLTKAVLNSSKTDSNVDDASANMDSITKNKDGSCGSSDLDDTEKLHLDDSVVATEESDKEDYNRFNQNTSESIHNKSTLSITVNVIQSKTAPEEVKENHDDSKMSIDCEYHTLAQYSTDTHGEYAPNESNIAISECIGEFKKDSGVSDKIKNITFDNSITNDKNQMKGKDEQKVPNAFTENKIETKETVSLLNKISAVSTVTAPVNTAISRLLSKDETSIDNIEEIDVSTQVSDTIKEVKLDTLTNKYTNTQHFIASDSQLLEKRFLKTTTGNCQDVNMEVYENVDNVIKPVEDPTIETNLCEANNSAIKVYEDVNLEVKRIENTSLKIETVSSKSVKDIDFTVACSDTVLKDAQNVTIEVSVTEKKNDDTLDSQLQEGHQENICKQKPSPETEMRVDTLNFLDKCIIHEENVAAENDVISEPKNHSTPQKIKILEEQFKYSTKSPTMDCNLHTCHNVENAVKISKSSKHQNNDTNTEKKDDTLSRTLKIDDKDATMNDEDHVLNKSGHSDSILLSNDPMFQNDTHTGESSIKSDSIFDDSRINKSACVHNPVIQTSEINFEKTFDSMSEENITLDDSTRSRSLLETSQINKSAQESVSEDYFESSTRQYIESPTFTQILENDEFFRDVNEAHNNSTKSEFKKSNQSIDSKQIIIHQNDTTTNNVAEIFQGDSEEASDDEPSPEYESLDEEITEDFRKHMLSIENTIKDKNNEEQIVKICNEIAEKAKLSPTKKDNLDINLKCIAFTNSEEETKTDPTEKDKPSIEHTESRRKTPEDIRISFQDRPSSRTGKRNKSQTHTEHDKQWTTTQKGPVSVKLTIKDKNELKECKDAKTSVNECKNNKILCKKNNPKINSDASYNDVLYTNKSKVISRSRQSLKNATRRASTNVKITPSKIKQYRRSSQYDPKVLLVRLEQETLDCTFEAAKASNEDTPKNNNSTVSVQGEVPDTKYIENKIKQNNQGKSKNRLSLSLKRARPSNIKDNRNSLYYQLEVNVEKSKNTTQERDKNPVEINDISIQKNSDDSKKEDTAISNEESKNIDHQKSKLEVNINHKAPKKINLENGSTETFIPDPVIANGYYHNLNRKYTDTPEFCDSDFSIDAVSLNSEDSEVSLPNSVDSIPKRNLRPRTTLNAMKNPIFLKFLELQRDQLLDEHPEFHEEELIMYLYETWQYENLNSATNDNNVIQIKETPLKEVEIQKTPSHSLKKKKCEPKNSIENYFRDKYEKSRKTVDFSAETEYAKEVSNNDLVMENAPSKSSAEVDFKESVNKTEIIVEQTNKTFVCVDQNPEKRIDVFEIKATGDMSMNTESVINKRSLRSKTLTPKSVKKNIETCSIKSLDDNIKNKNDVDTESVSSVDSEIPLRHLRSKLLKENAHEPGEEISPEVKVDVVCETPSSSKDPVNNEIKEDIAVSIVPDNEPLVKQKKKKSDKSSMEDPEFLKYLGLNQNSVMDENPQLSQDEIVDYLYKSWLYEENSKPDVTKNVEVEQTSLVKGLNDNEVAPTKKVRRRPKVEKQTDDLAVIPIMKEKPRRRIAQPFYNENFSDIEEELEMFEIFKTKKTSVVSKPGTSKEKSNSPSSKSVKTLKVSSQIEDENVKQDSKEYGADEAPEKCNGVECDPEWYFAKLTAQKPNIFKGLIREKVCEICYNIGHLIKCKGCNGVFHPDCVKREAEAVVNEKEPLSMRGRKKKLKPGRKPKSLEDSESHSDDKLDTSADISMEEIVPSEIAFDAETFESQIALKMKEILDVGDVHYDSYSSDDSIDWRESVAGKCEIIDVKWKRRNAPIDYSDFKCNNCQRHDVPICFVCKSAVSKSGVKIRQKCNIVHCYKYYHLKCLDHWPQTQFNSGVLKRKRNEFFEALTCPRHVCHSCVSDDPRGCKTRFSSDKLAKCVRCPATYHALNKCLPAGSRLLTASHIICPRHYEPKSGKVPCHVNTGWCFICAQGGSLICCEYCPTSFHAECLNMEPPEGKYMCEECETGRLPLYGELVWVKLGHYRWWPAVVLHPSEIPENIMLVKHEYGEFCVRFFGQYDYYWVNRGRVFPYQDGDTGRISSQKSKINDGFILAMKHAQKAFTIMKNAEMNGDESLDIESSVRPPYYVKLKCNKPCGSLCGKKIEDPSLSLTQCECNPDEPDPCGPYSQCLNRVLLTECGPTCRAGDRCMNRAFEKRLYPKLVPYRAPNRGWGLKTLDEIKAGQFVIEYVGELIDEEEFRRRMRRKHEIRDENFYFLTLDKERMIDAGPKGNVARFMNHCCEPNCETQKWTVLGDVRVGLFAIDDIPANSEVTFNYNLECTGIEKKPCLCGAKRCSGYIGAKPKQEESQPKKGKAKRRYNKKKKTEESPSASKHKSKRLGRPPKPKELSDLEKDLLIINNAANTKSNEEPSTLRIEEKNSKSLKRKRASIPTDEESLSNNQGPSVKKLKSDVEHSEVGD